MKKVLLLLLTLILLFTGCDSGEPNPGCGSEDPGGNPLPGVTITETSSFVQIEPTAAPVKSGLVFYPGAMIEPTGYIDPLQLIAAEGYRVLILKSRMNMAIFNIQGAAQAIKKFNDIDAWFIGGHSLGGVAAVKAILETPEAFKGLALMASYPDEGDDLSQWTGAVISLSAENDGLTTEDEIEASKALLPQALVLYDLADFPQTATVGRTIFYEIKGGNHAQFGSYGEQNNDGQATISEADQHQLIKESMLRFLSIN